MRTTNKSGIACFVQSIVEAGMKHVVCSPGSRNAPLVIAFDEHPQVETFVIHDERSAAFYALGMALELQAPVGVVCTSGSAMLNYYPAVAEAYYQGVLLVVMSADRPEEWVNHGDGQTIVQTNVYTNHIRYQGTITEYAADASSIDTIQTMVVDAFTAGNGDWKGPIHFNCPLSEPLYGVEEVVNYPAIVLPEHNTEELSQSAIEMIRQQWSKSTKKLILCGQMTPSTSIKNLMVELADDTSVAILVENTSNMVHPSFIHCIDRTLATISEAELSEFQPDLLITFGGAIISKRIKKFLRDCPGLVHYKVGVAFPEMDTYRALSASFTCSEKSFLTSLLALNEQPNSSSFGSKWKQRDYLAQEAVQEFMSNAPYSDLTVFDALLDFVPDGCNIHMSNSSVVRYCQLFDPIASMTYYSNRGVSGIDGSTSTACGVALMSTNKCNVLFTGDISFFYDSNALWNNYLPSNLRIVLINNNGGGIFKIIEGPNKTDQLVKYFEAPHTANAEYLCSAFNVGYHSAETIEEISSAMSTFYTASERPQLLEIKTPSQINDSVLKEFFAAIAKT